ncbi:MAG TPA: 4a-hydroxytetrahydrobiopterin dehydratase [Allosphingosinicella sp.]
MAVLTTSERAAALATLSGWTFDAERNGIAKTFKFGGFGEAFAFMTRVALEAEKADHHPEWTNVWNRVDVLLSTHSEGGVTEKDIALAGEMEKIAG